MDNIFGAAMSAIEKAKFSARNMFKNAPFENEIYTSRGKSVEFDKTTLARDRLRENPFFEEATPENRNGVWQGRRVIGKDSKINGGVYLGGGPREAVVVNDDETQPELGRLYERLLQNIKNEGGDYKTKALREVFELVSETLEYDKDEVEAIYESRGSVPDKKLGLNIYVANGVGVCRHQALLCGYLLERLVEENHLSGTVSVDRNQIEGIGGHAWVRYTSGDGDVVIMDSTQDYLGKLSDLTSDQNRWFYERPEDSKRK